MLMERCSMGVGCDEWGVCYADAHGQPEQCPHYTQRIEAQRATTGTGVVHESLVANGDAPEPSQHTPENHHDR